MGDLIVLAERCEAATGPDRELDRSIQSFIDPDHVAYMDRAFAEMQAACESNGLWPQREEAAREHANTSPRYTASLDAAMKLVKVRRRWSCADHGLTEDRPYALVGQFGCYAATPALALTAAALRALATKS